MPRWELAREGLARGGGGLARRDGWRGGANAPVVALGVA